MRLGRRGRHVRAARAAARPAAVHQRRQRDHADHEHAAQPRPRARSSRTWCTCTAPAPPRGSSSAASCASSQRAPPRLSPARAGITGEQGRVTAGAARRAVPGLARARGVPVRARRAARDDERALGARRRSRAAAHGALPARRARRRRRARRGGTIRFCKSGIEAVSDGEQPILAAGESAGAELPYRLSHGHLPHLRRAAALRPGARSAHRPRPWPAWGNASHLHQRARGRRRDRPVTPNDAKERTMSATPDPAARRRLSLDEEPESPLARLTPEQIEQLGREFDAIHDEVLRRSRRPRLTLHPQHDQAAPPARARRTRDAASARAASHCGWPARRRCRWRRSSRTWRSATT